jgi:hypothetical protein
MAETHIPAQPQGVQASATFEDAFEPIFDRVEALAESLGFLDFVLFDPANCGEGQNFPAHNRRASHASCPDSARKPGGSGRPLMNYGLCRAGGRPMSSYQLTTDHPASRDGVPVLVGKVLD